MTLPMNHPPANRPAPAPMCPAKLPLMRPQRGRWLLGVCRGVALHLGVPTGWVRLAFVASTLIWGAGLVAYLFLWLVVPVGDPVAAAVARGHAASAAVAPLAAGNRDMRTGRTRAEATAEAMGGTTESLAAAVKRAPKPALVAVIGLLLVTMSVALGVTDHGGLILPLLLASIGLVIAWSRFDARHGQIPTMAAGLVLIFIAYATYVAYAADATIAAMTAGVPLDGLATPRSIILAGLVMMACAVLAVLPWANAILRTVSVERAMKEREEERADMTAHLHDGVLQTLALIQLHHTEPDTVFTLARGQERELRAWLYQERVASDRSVSAGLKAIAAEVEDGHGRPVDVVTVGDARPSAATDALLDAARQALVNAVTHGGEPVSVYCEANATAVEVFVRDHGAGFDVDAIPPDRLGIRESIMGRVRRRGGTVEIVSRPDWGTEVRMRMPIAPTPRASRQDAQEPKRMHEPQDMRQTRRDDGRTDAER